MVGKVIPATPDEKAYQHTIRTYCGCLPCLLEGKFDRHATIQHVSEGRKRVGQWAVYGLCEWHHLARCDRGRDWRRMVAVYGPSLALSKQAYYDAYGTERQLMDVQEYMVGLFDARPWQEHRVPADIAMKVRSFWVSLVA